MKFIITFLFLILSFNVGANERSSVILLVGDIPVEVREFMPSRATPTLYYRQAMESIPVIYPQSKIITKISMSKLESNENVFYSLVSYIEQPLSSVVSAGGQVLVKNRAWQFSVEIPKELYPQLQNELIEKVANLAF